jgi:enterochelin esterase family protein
MKTFPRSLAVSVVLCAAATLGGAEAGAPASAPPTQKKGQAAPQQNHLETPATGALWAPSPKGAAEFDNYTLGPDSLVQPGVPQGTWEKFVWDKSDIFPKTVREVWVYVPAQYDPAKPACLLVLQDGPRQYAMRERTPEDNRARRTLEYATPNVLDNLIHRGELPVIITVFINPGSIATDTAPAIDANGRPNFSNRSVEYDSVSDDYSQFLAKEILPPIEKKFNVRKDPAGRAIGGISSGAICAFTVAWNHPDWFGKVLSDVGSFTNIRGGHVYPQLVRDAAKKPIRGHLQDGTNDNRRPATPERDWYLQNKLMFEALRDKRYDVRYVLGDGAHNSKHGAALLPDALRWLWRDDVKR